MAQITRNGLLLDPLMHVSARIRNAVKSNRVLVKERDKLLRSLERENYLILKQLRDQKSILNDSLLKTKKQTVSVDQFEGRKKKTSSQMT